MRTRHRLEPPIIRRRDLDCPSAGLTDQMMVVVTLGRADPIQAQPTMLYAIQVPRQVEGVEPTVDGGQTDPAPRVVQDLVQVLGRDEIILCMQGLPDGILLSGLPGSTGSHRSAPSLSSFTLQHRGKEGKVFRLSASHPSSRWPPDPGPWPGGHRSGRSDGPSSGWSAPRPCRSRADSTPGGR